jgi:hypothetical protein
VYEVQRTFTGTQAAWLEAVNNMQNGWVGVICLLHCRVLVWQVFLRHVGVQHSLYTFEHTMSSLIIA